MALHRFLVLALLVPLCAAGVFRMPLRRRESLHDRLVREGKWEAYAKQREALRRSGQIPSRVRDYADNVYDTDIYLGTPPQRFTVIFDTGSGDLWVTDASCQSPRCAEKARYDNSTSSSYEYDGTKWFIGYKDGTHIDGHWAKESLTLGDLNASSLAVKSAFFAQAVTETTPNPANLDDFDGILGLSRGSQFGKTSLATAIQQGLLTEPVFTIWLEHVYAESNVTGGQVLFGGIDTEHCGEVIDYVPIANPNDQSWNFAVAGFQFNDVTAAGDFVGITDTGTSDMYVPLSIFDAVVSAANATPSDSRPRVACDAKFSPIVLTINGKQYPVSAEALINRDSEGCYLSLGASDLLILGDPFIRQYCQIHDLGQDRLGFAKALSK